MRCPFVRVVSWWTIINWYCRKFTNIIRASSRSEHDVEVVYNGFSIFFKDYARRFRSVFSVLLVCSVCLNSFFVLVLWNDISRYAQFENSWGFSVWRDRQNRGLAAFGLVFKLRHKYALTNGVFFFVTTHVHHLCKQKPLYFLYVRWEHTSNKEESLGHLENGCETEETSKGMPPETENGTERVTERSSMACIPYSKIQSIRGKCLSPVVILAMNLWCLSLHYFKTITKIGWEVESGIQLEYSWRLERLNAYIHTYLLIYIYMQLESLVKFTCAHWAARRGGGEKEIDTERVSLYRRQTWHMRPEWDSPALFNVEKYGSLP